MLHRTFLLVVVLLMAGCFRIETGGSSAFYETDPRYTAGVPFQTVDPRTGATVYVPGSSLRAHWAMQPYTNARAIYGPKK